MRQKQTNSNRGFGAANTIMNNIIPLKSSCWKHLPDPICKSVLGRERADGISCTQHWAVMGWGQASLAEHSQSHFGTAGGLCVCHLWGGYYKWGQVVLVKIGAMLWGGRGCTQLVGTSTGPQELRAPCRGSLLLPWINVDVHGDCRGREGPLAAPSEECGSLSGNSKDSLVVWLPLVSCHWHTPCSTWRAGALPEQLGPAQSGRRCGKHTSVYKAFVSNDPGIAQREATEPGECKRHLLALSIVSPWRRWTFAAVFLLQMEGHPSCWPPWCFLGNVAGTPWHPCSREPDTRAVTRTVFFIRWFLRWFLRFFMCADIWGFQGREVQSQGDFRK